MNASDFNRRILAPAAEFCDGIAPRTANPLARLLLLAVAGQEGGWSARRQAGGGPAHSFWQAEQGGGVLGVLSAPATRPIMTVACEALAIGATVPEVYEAITYNDALAYTLARCIVWPDPRPLPAAGDEEGAWQQYVLLWRPGKPARARWAARYAEALAAWTGRL